jgi:Methyltransferase domain
MVWLERLLSAIREGRLISGVRRRWLIFGILSERRLRRQLDLPAKSGSTLPLISRRGNFNASEESLLVKHCFDRALSDESPLPREIREIDGMSGQKYRSFINHLVSMCPNPRYLEVGSWAGSTVTAALSENRASALCIDNWSLFGGPKDRFFQNINKVLSEKIQFKFIENDFRSVNYGSIGQFNIYLFDGPHQEADQYDGVVLAQPALTDTFFLIVDDWNWRAVRLGTLRALAAIRCELVCSIEIRTTLDESHASVSGKESDWHNGYFIAVVRKAAGCAPAPRR